MACRPISLRYLEFSSASAPCCCLWVCSRAPVALLLAAEMAIAIWKVHSSAGGLVVKAYEFPLVVAAACLALATTGAGGLSFDPYFLAMKASQKAPLLQKSRD